VWSKPLASAFIASNAQLLHKAGHQMAYLFVLSAIACVLLYHVLNTYQALKRNIARAKSSGLPYVVTPVHVFGVGWLATYYLWIPILNKLPGSLKGLWLEYVRGYHLTC
jgi:hypothetical protein